jgi:hypothetical protein
VVLQLAYALGGLWNHALRISCDTREACGLAERTQHYVPQIKTAARLLGCANAAGACGGRYLQPNRDGFANFAKDVDGRETPPST